MSKPPPLTDRELDVAFRERATDEDIRALRDALASICTKEAIVRAVKGEPKASTVTGEKDKVRHPFAAG
jgi:formaldehyde-activating enzyme involved in methanogenesis